MPSPQIKFDHLVVAASTLDTGVSWVEDRLGVTVPRGGQHDHMATHNCVGRLTGDTFLEIIAVNPNDTPDRVRWFSMDEPSFHARLDHEGAFLHHWVINTSDIAQTLGSVRYDPGVAMDMSRGDMRWKISVRDNGVLARDGIVPTIIEWPEAPHPARNMPELGLELKALHLHSKDPAATLQDLESVGAMAFCDVVPAAENRLTAAFSNRGELVYL